MHEDPNIFGNIRIIRFLIIFSYERIIAKLSPFNTIEYSGDFIFIFIIIIIFCENGNLVFVFDPSLSHDDLFAVASPQSLPSIFPAIVKKVSPQFQQKFVC